MPLDDTKIRMCVVCSVDISALHHNAITCNNGCRGRLTQLRANAYREANIDKMSVYQRDWYLKNREKLLIKAEDRRKANPEYNREYGKSHRVELNDPRKKRRSASPDKYRKREVDYYRRNREKLNEERLKREHGVKLLPPKPSSGLCEACGKAPKNKILCLDHCHVFGTLRGWICVSCNRALGLVKDDPEVLHGLINYLNRRDKPWFTPSI